MRNILISFLVLCSMSIGQTTFANPMEEAIEQGDIQTLNRLLSEGVDVNGSGDGAWTPLHHAAWHGNVKAIRILLANGAVVGPVDGNHGYTAFDFLARSNDVPGVNAMLQFGIDANTRNQYEDSPIITAATYASVDVVRFLCRKGANVDARNVFGTTALMAIADGGIPEADRQPSDHFEVIKALLDCGADPNMKNDEGKTALDIAIADNSNQEAIELLKSVTAR